MLLKPSLLGDHFKEHWIEIFEFFVGVLERPYFGEKTLVFEFFGEGPGMY